ncbi:MAG TPA: hypothetical protein VJ890_04425 [Vineibacter sp.]|nr:hypothetical protein [Vineibacter sp.]
MSGTQQPTTAPAANDEVDRPQPADAGAASDNTTRPRPTIAWTRSGAGFSATIDGRTYRVTKYPADAPIQSPYGAYAEGRFIGGGLTLDNVKSRCNAHAARLRFRARSAPSPEADSDPTA